MYREQLQNCLKKLCADSTDALEFREKLKRTCKDLEKENDRRTKLSDELLKTQRASAGFERLSSCYESQKKNY